MNLPDIDGHAVCRALKAEPETAGVPVLMLTVRDNDADVLAGLEAGADDYVAKDSDPAIVLARVRRLIQFRQLATVAVLNEHLVQVGRLLAGIVHEIRGPLSVIRGSAELMRLQIKPDDPYHAVGRPDPPQRAAPAGPARTPDGDRPERPERARDAFEVGPLVRESADLFLKGTDPRGNQVAIDADCGDEPAPRPGRRRPADPGLPVPLRQRPRGDRPVAPRRAGHRPRRGRAATRAATGSRSRSPTTAPASPRPSSSGSSSRSSRPRRRGAATASTWPPRSSRSRAAA